VSGQPDIPAQNVCMVEDILAPIPMMLIYADQNGMLYYQPLQPSSRVAGHE
jgi:hypothetical protein